MHRGVWVLAGREGQEAVYGGVEQSQSKVPLTVMGSEVNHTVSRSVTVHTADYKLKIVYPTIVISLLATSIGIFQYHPSRN